MTKKVRPPFVPKSPSPKCWDGRGPATRHVSDAHEQTIAHVLKTTQTPGSGSGRWVKGDTQNDLIFNEDKVTDGKGYRVTAETLQKLYRLAFEAGNKMPVLSIGITSIAPPTPQDWVLIPAELFAELIEVFKELAWHKQNQ